MANKVVCIEVGYSQTRICEMDYRVKNPKIYTYVSVPTPQGSVEDGYIVQSEELIDAVKKALTDHYIKTKQVVFTVSSSKIANREVVLPTVKKNQIGALIKANASDYFPIDLTEYEIAYLLLENEKEDDKTEHYKAMVIAASKSLIDGYDKFAAACGLELISLDYSGNSIFQSMKNECREETELVIKVEEKNAIAAVISGDRLVLQRNIVYGIDDAVNILQRSYIFGPQDYYSMLDVMKKKLTINVALSEETQIIERPEEQDDSALSEKFVNVRQNATETLAPLVGNVSRVADLYNSRNTSKPIKRVVLIGLGSDIVGLDKLFTNELGIKVEVLKDLDSVPWGKAEGRGAPGPYLTAIGAGYDPVGLISAEKKITVVKNTNFVSASILLGVFFVVACVGLSVFSILKYNEAKKEQDRLKGLERKYAPAEKVFEKYNQNVELINEVRHGYALTQHHNENLLAFLEELEEKLPAEAKVSEIKSNNQSAEITLRVADKEEAAKVIQTLRDFESVMDVSIGNVDQEDIEELAKELEQQLQEALENLEEGEEIEEIKPGVIFSIICTYYPIQYEVIPGTAK